jgi:hypothetical protein
VRSLGKWKWLLASAVGAAGLLGLGYAALHFFGGGPQEFPDLPEWFQPAHRVRRPTNSVPPQGYVHVQGLGWMPPEEVPPPGDFTEKWLDEHFTHYVSPNAFYWSAPGQRLTAAAGKLLAGTKVIYGKEVDGLALVCTRTRDNRVMNLFMQPEFLRERAEGPPRAGGD